MDYLIWSFTHRQWWRPNQEGYTTDIDRAGLYSATEAGEIVTRGVFNESVQIVEPIAHERGAPTVTSLWEREQ